LIFCATLSLDFTDRTDDGQETENTRTLHSGIPGVGVGEEVVVGMGDNVGAGAAFGEVEVLGLTAHVPGKVAEPCECSGVVFETAPKISEDHVVCAQKKHRRDSGPVEASKARIVGKGNNQRYLFIVHMMTILCVTLCNFVFCFGQCRQFSSDSNWDMSTGCMRGSRRGSAFGSESGCCRGSCRASSKDVRGSTTSNTKQEIGG